MFGCLFIIWYNNAFFSIASKDASLEFFLLVLGITTEIPQGTLFLHWQGTTNYK